MNWGKVSIVAIAMSSAVVPIGVVAFDVIKKDATSTATQQMEPTIKMLDSMVKKPD